MILSQEDCLAIKNKKISWVCKGEFEEGKGKGKGTKGIRGRGKYATMVKYGRKFHQRVVTFVGVARQSRNVNVSQEYFVPIFYPQFKL